MRVHDILVHKGSAVATIEPGATVAEVLDSLARNGIGALVVTGNGTRVEGIISERDIVRALQVHGADLLGMPVVDVMHVDMPACVPDDQVSNLIDGSGSATYTLRADNEDTLTLALAVQPGGTLNVEGGVTFSGTYTVVRGTGRFRKNTGSGVFAGSALFLNPTEGIGSFSLVGLLITR